MSNILRQWSPNCRFAFGGACLSSEQGGYGFGSIDLKEAQNLMSYALEYGLRVFDTAPIYGFGHSEEWLGEMLGKRDDVAIVSKSGVGWHENRRVNMSNDVPQTQKMLEDSLRRLGRERIEIYMIHWPDAKVDIRHPLEYLLRQQEKGKIKHLGLCNTNLEDWQKATSMTRIDVLQSQVNVFEKPAQDLVQAAALKNVPMMGWGTFDKGIIAGTVTKNRNFESCDARSWAPWWKNSNKDQKIALMEKVLPILEKHGHNGIEFGLKYSLDNCEMPLIGAKSVKQLQQVFAAFANLPSEELMQELIQLKEQLLPATAN